MGRITYDQGLAMGKRQQRPEGWTVMRRMPVLGPLQSLDWSEPR